LQNGKEKGKPVKRTKKDPNSITFSDRDRDFFIEILRNPPQPNKHMRKAFKEYERFRSASSVKDFYTNDSFRS